VTPVLAFDLETIPNIAALRAALELPDELDQAAVAEAAFARRREATGSEFLPLHQHQVLVIACVLRGADGLHVWSLDASRDGEGPVLQRFFDGIEKFTPQLVSWNGGGFDLPVLHYRALVHGVRAARYFDLGDNEREFRFNNYLNRYHTRHLDLMDFLSLYQARASAPLDEIARQCGLPGKLGMHGARVWPTFVAGDTAAICRYCETDALNTYLVYLRFQLLRGALSASELEAENRLVLATIRAINAPHWREFDHAWTGKPN
jgi:predicted PolB exonuclease-like 3'-5' exonuclease